MNRDNISALMVAIIVLYFIFGFTINFNNLSGLNKAWPLQQKDKDMLVTGPHSPDFTFEKNYTNVKAAVQRFGITYPAISDTTIENHTVTMKINATQFQHIDKSQFKKAPEFVQISGYINTPNNNPLTLSSLKGKVVLVYIWTYTCINSIRPMPYIDDWNQKYSNNGLVIVGLHSPDLRLKRIIPM